MSESTGRVADATGNWVDSLPPSYARPYPRLARLDRPIGSWLLLMPCWWSVGLAGMHNGRFPSLWHIVLFFIGAFALHRRVGHARRRLHGECPGRSRP